MKIINHYENFPVGSILIPKDCRKDIALIYWFARTADDIADEGELSRDERLEQLNNFEKDFLHSLEGRSDNEYFILLSETIKNRNICAQYFLDLLSAFKQDATKNRFETFDEILDYCNRSANPVGRILLQLFEVDDTKALLNSDKICTALQLANFYQDAKIDFGKGRIYFPLDELKRFSVTEKMFELNENNHNIKALVKHNLQRAQILFDEGKNILNHLSGRFKLEIKLTIAGGEKILSKIEANDYDVLNYRPKLTKIDFATILIKAFCK